MRIRPVLRANAPVPRRTAALLAAATASLVLTACGGSGTAPTPSGTTAGQGTADSGARLFVSVGCGACHTLAAAGSNGQVGPDLDSLQLTVAEVERQVRRGGGGMPAFADRLSTAQIHAMSVYVDHVAQDGH